MKQCPYCAEETQDEAIVCGYCGRDLSTPVVPPTGAPSESIIFLERKPYFSKGMDMLAAWPVEMDGNKIGSIGVGQRIELKVPVGRHRFCVKTSRLQSDAMELNLAGGEITELACGMEVGLFTKKLFLCLESTRGGGNPVSSSPVGIQSPNTTSTPSFSAANVGREKPGWATPVVVISILVGIVGLAVIATTICVLVVLLVNR